MRFAPVSANPDAPSLTALILAANLDGIAPNPFAGTIVPSGPSRISLYEIQRGSPEGSAYRDYHERYAAGTDRERIAGEFRVQQVDEGLAAGTPLNADES